ncbi:hypothetical protein OXX69_010976 [Metschnikowia pulcherrima]
MGFIFAECGFKRRRQNINVARPGKPLARPTKSGSKLPESISNPSDVRCSSGPSSPLEDVQLDKVELYQNLSDSALPGDALEYVAPSFLDLPPEVLFRIFSFAGLAPENVLASTCKYLHELLDFTQNDYLLEMVVERNFLFDLSGGKSRDWFMRFLRKYKALPNGFITPEAKSRAFNIPMNAADMEEAIDSRIFVFPGITSRHVHHLTSRFGTFDCVDRAVADSQQRRKRRYLEWRYMIVKKYVTLATEASNNSADVEPDQLLREVEASEPCLSFKKAHNLDGFEPLTKNTEIPPELYKRVDAERLDLIYTLKSRLHMPIGRPLSLVSSFFAHNDDISQDKLDLLFDICRVRLARESEIAEALKVLDECRQRLFALPLETRQMHPLSDALDQFYAFLKETITLYYETNPHENSSMIWELLRELQIPELLDHVVGMGVTVPLHLF